MTLEQRVEGNQIMERNARSVAAFASGIVLNARCLRLSLAALVLTVAASLAPVSAQAAFIYDLTVSNGWTGSGGIAFDTLSGNTTAGVTAFSFHVSSGAGSPQDYDLADLAAVDWTIDSSFNLSLLLSAVVIPFGTGVSAILLTNQSGDHFITCGLAIPNLPGSLTCRVNSDNSGAVTYNGVLSTSRVTSVPEPSTLALFGLGLAGLGWMSRRRKAM